MSDFYTEQLVKRKNGLREYLLKLLLIMAVIASFLSVLFIPSFFGLFVPVIVVVIVYFLFRRLSVEYEYQYVNGDLDIDKIYYKTRRKHAWSMNVHALEYLAPADHFGLKEYHPSGVRDFSSHTGDAQLYAMIVSEENEQIEVLFEPNEEIVNGFYMAAPGKVIRK